MGGGQALWQMDGRTMGAYMPAHYIKQFHPKYIGMDAGDTRRRRRPTSTAGSAYIKNRWDWRLNPELPVLTPWKVVTPINNPTWVMERNPFFYEVDTAGNQLPYIDRIQMTVAENLEVLNLRAIAGQYDLQERHTAMTKLPVFLENRDKVGYDVRLDPALNGSDATLQINHAYEADAEVAKWLHTADFRRALSMGIDRDQLNETFWLGIGYPGLHRSGRVHALQPRARSGGRSGRRSTSSSPTRCSTRSASRRRTVRGTGSGPTARAACASSSWPRRAPSSRILQVAEMIKEQWKKIGIQADVQGGGAQPLLHPSPDRTSTRSPSGRTTAPELLLSRSPARDSRWIQASRSIGTPIAVWYASGGKQGKAPDDTPAPQGDGHVPLRERQEGSRADQDRPGDLQDHDRRAVLHRDGRPVARDDGVRIASRKMGNMASRQINAQHCRTPGTSQPSTYYFKA
mgnify:CR=1 FL=1